MRPLAALGPGAEGREAAADMARFLELGLWDAALPWHGAAKAERRGNAVVSPGQPYRDSIQTLSAASQRLGVAAGS